MPQESFRWEINPDAVDASVRALLEHLRRLVDQGRYTRVRIKYKGNPILPDMPLAALLAAEGVSLWLTGPLRLVLMNLGVKAFVEVEFIHEASERVKEGQELFAAGEVEAAEAKYKEALGMKADDPAAMYHLAVLYRVTGRKDEALALFERVAKTDAPEAPRAQEAVERLNNRTTPPPSAPKPGRSL